MDWVMSPKSLRKEGIWSALPLLCLPLADWGAEMEGSAGNRGDKGEAGAHSQRQKFRHQMDLSSNLCQSFGNLDLGQLWPWGGLSLSCLMGKMELSPRLPGRTGGVPSTDPAHQVESVPHPHPVMAIQPCQFPGPEHRQVLQLFRWGCFSDSYNKHPCKQIVLSLIYRSESFFFFFFRSRCVQDLISQIRDQTCAPCSGSKEFF